MAIVRAYLKKMKSALRAVLGDHAERLLALGLTVGVIAAACGGSPTDQATGTPGTGDRGDAELGLTTEEVARRVEVVESLVAACMNDAGFDYVPVDYVTARAAMDSDSKPAGLTGDEFRDEFGYGITTLFAGADSQAVLGAGEDNIRIREGLTAADRVAYSRNLYGENPSATFVTALDEEDFSATGGCTRQAVQKVFSPNELGAGFVNYQNAQGARVDEDPRVIAAYQDWANCLREAGYGYRDKAEIDADLASRLDTITGGQDPQTLPPEAQSTLAELQGQERAIAAADRDCELKFVDAVKTEVENELLGPDASQP